MGALPGDPSKLPYPDKFNAAVEFVTRKPEGANPLGDETSLVLYALHQQATVGPAGNKPRTWTFSMLESAKWQAHSQLGQMSKMEAMRLYVKVVEDEQKDWGVLLRAALEKSPLEPAPADAESVPKPHSNGAVPAPPAAEPEAKPVAEPETPPKPDWELVATTGTPRPPPRYEHAVAIVNNLMYVVGGNYGGRYLNDTWALNLDMWEWSAVQTREGDSPPAQSQPVVDANGEKPPEEIMRQHILPPCAGHRLVLWGKSVLCIGGHVKLGPQAKDKSPDMALRSFCTTKNTWTLLKPIGEAPPARGSHTATLIGTRVYIFGGEDLQRRPHGDLYILDLPDMAWVRPETFGTPPLPRSAHVAVAHNKRYLLIFGGGSVAHCFNDLHVLDTETMEWSQPETLGVPPSPRAGHAADVYEGQWYIVGGGNNSSGCSDILALDLGPLGQGGPLTWRPVGQAATRSPLAAEGLSLVASRKLKGLLAYGGYNGRYHSEVHLYRPAEVDESTHGVGAQSAGGPQAGAGPARRPSAKAEMGPAGTKSDAGEGAPLANGVATAAASAAEAREDGAAREVAAARREADAIKSAAATELGLIRHQLASAQAATSEAEKKLEAALADAQKEAQKVFGLEVQVAELTRKLESVAELEKELEHYRRLAKEAEQSKAKGGIWGYISGQ